MSKVWCYEGFRGMVGQHFGGGRYLSGLPTQVSCLRCRALMATSEDEDLRECFSPAERDEAITLSLGHGTWWWYEDEAPFEGKRIVRELDWGGYEEDRSMLLEELRLLAG